MIGQSLPLWCSHGWDSSRGGFVERLDLSGRADDLIP
jgi:mannose/cellobiose epimerase-like protein (N-acyl-D-glucosamine 2-epimerase family)